MGQVYKLYYLTDFQGPKDICNTSEMKIEKMDFLVSFFDKNFKEYGNSILKLVDYIKFTI